MALHRVPSPIYLLLPGLLNIAGSVFSVDWFMQGLERMGVFTLYSIAGRSLGVLLTFVLVHGPQDTWIACALQSAGAISASLRRLRDRTPLPESRADGNPAARRRRPDLAVSPLFPVADSWMVYSTAAPLALALIAGSSEVGLFAGADRITRVAIMLTFPLSMVMYPRVNALMAQSREAAARVAGPFLGFQILLSVCIGAVFFLAADPLATIVLGPGFQKSAEVLRWLSALSLLTGLTGALSRQFLIPLGWSRDVSRITLSFTLLYLVLLVIGCRTMGATGAAIALIATEGMLTLAFILHLLKHERQFALASLTAMIETPRHVSDVFATLCGRLRSS